MVGAGLEVVDSDGVRSYAVLKGFGIFSASDSPSFCIRMASRRHCSGLLSGSPLPVPKPADPPGWYLFSRQSIFFQSQTRLDGFHAPNTNDLEALIRAGVDEVLSLDLEGGQGGDGGKGDGEERGSSFLDHVSFGLMLRESCRLTDIMVSAKPRINNGHCRC